MNRVPAVVRYAARAMRVELEANRLVVVKKKSTDGWVRIAVEHNAYWYRKFCGKFLRRYGKKDRTMIRRQHVIRALKELSSGRCATTYAGRLLGECAKWAMSEHEDRVKYRKSKRA